MKIVNKSRFIRGIALIILAAVIAITRIFVFPDAVHGLLKPVIVIGVCLLAAVYSMVMAVRVDGEEDTGEEK